MGAALWLRTEVATAVRGESVQHTPIARLTLAQDTGAAIRGIGRIDLFVGSGEAARIAAARTSRPGALYLIISKSRRSKRKG
jgi:membrane-bound lytic murein transglycosylase